MDFEKYTERARGFIQSAQSLALREGLEVGREGPCVRIAFRQRKGRGLADHVVQLGRSVGRCGRGRHGYVGER